MHPPLKYMGTTSGFPPFFTEGGGGGRAGGGGRKGTKFCEILFVLFVER